MALAMGSSYLMHPHFLSSSASSSSSPFQSVFFVGKSNAGTKRRKRAAAAACVRQEDHPNEIVFTRKRAILFVGISVLPFLQLRAGAVQGLVLKKNEPETLAEVPTEELTVQRHAPNPVVSLLNGLGIFGTGVLGALYALARKEKKDTDITIESMTAMLKEKEAEIALLRRNFESKLLSEQEERAKQLRKAKEEQQVLVNQLTSANNTISGLGLELSKEKKRIEELKAHIGNLENSLVKAGEDKKGLELEVKEKLSLIEAHEDKISLLKVELKDKEANVQQVSSSLAEKELELKELNSIYKQTKHELGKAHAEIRGLEDEILKCKKELESKVSVVNELNSSMESLIVERDESNRNLNALQKEYDDLRTSSEKKAHLDALLLAEKENNLNQLKEKLEFALNEVSGNQAIIADLTKEKEDLRKILDEEVNSTRNLRRGLKITEEALGKSRSEVSNMAQQLKQSINRCSELEAEVSRVQAEFAAATETWQKNLDNAKQSGELLASEITAVKEQLKKTKDELQTVSRELAGVTENRDSIQKELVDVYERAEVTAKELIEEKKIVSSLNKELQNLEMQIIKDKEARKSLEMDLEEATKSLDEMNRNALMLSGNLEMTNSRISTLEDEKQLLYKSLIDEKNASMEAKENMGDAHNMVLRLGKERENLEKKSKKFEEELASAKGEILRLRSQINSSKTLVNDQHSQNSETEDNKVTVNAKKTRRRKASS